MLLVALCALPAPTLAQRAADANRDRARVLYQQARELDANGRTAEAITLAEEAYRLYPSVGTRYALGLLHERAGDTEAAIDHYRMALAEAEGRSDALDAQIRAGLDRLGGEATPLEPTPIGAQLEPPPEEPAHDDEPEPEESPEPTSLAPPEPPPNPRGLRLRAGALADAARIDRAWAAYAAVGWISDLGLYVELGVSAPHLSVSLEGGIEIGDAIVRPIVAGFVGISPLRAFDGPQDGGLFLGPRVGLALHPLEEIGLSFSFDAALAIDVLRASEGFAYAVPLSLGVRWVP